MATIAVLVVLLSCVVAYRRFTQPPPEVLEWIKGNPNQPMPELVAWGISPAILCLFLAVPVVAIATVVIA